LMMTLPVSKTPNAIVRLGLKRRRNPVFA